MKEKETKMLPFNLQFFAEGDNGDGEQTGNEAGNEDSKGGDDSQNKTGEDNGEQSKGAEKTFTQKQVSDMMAKEKKQGKQAILNSLGFKTEQEAKDAMSLLKALQDSQKSEEQKQKEANDAAVAEKEKAEQRAILAESKLSCIENGVNKESVDDVLTIAMSKVTDDKSLDDVIADMKKESRYASFFVSESDGGKGSDGTGSTPSHSSSQGKSGGDYGKQLAEKFNATKSVGTKSKFF